MPDLISFRSDGLTLQGALYKPDGAGPFPTLLYNHGSAPGMLNQQAFEELGPLFIQRGWVFFAPYRRGQGHSAAAGPFIGDEIAAAGTLRACIGSAIAVLSVFLFLFVVVRKRRRRTRAAWGLGLAVVAAVTVRLSAAQASAATMVRLLETDHFNDQRAAFKWLEQQSFVEKSKMATAGNSFGGVQAVLGAERLGYCAAVDAAGGAESWAVAGELRTLMTRAVRGARAPILFFQAENDYDISPSLMLASEMQSAGKPFDLNIYPAFGRSASEGHSFAWAGSAVWADDVFRFLSAKCSLGQRSERPDR
jgi:dienelactone hydrolase